MQAIQKNVIITQVFYLDFSYKGEYEQFKL